MDSHFIFYFNLEVKIKRYMILFYVLQIIIMIISIVLMIFVNILHSVCVLYLEYPSVFNIIYNESINSNNLNNINNENISSNSMREITFKFPKDDINQNKLLVTSKEQSDLLTNISNIIDKIYNSDFNFFK